MKVFERIVRKEIFSFLTNNNLQNPTQHGLREGRSGLSALLVVYDNILSVLSEGADHVDMIYPDFSKAFDELDHGLIYYKLKKYLWQT